MEVIYRGKMREHVVDGETKELAPVMLAEGYGYRGFEIGYVDKDGSGQGFLHYDFRIINAWRALELFQEVPEIGLKTLAQCWDSFDYHNSGEDLALSLSARDRP